MKVTTQRLRRVSADVAALAVAGVAARATWAHIVSVGMKYGEPMSVWLPISVDGMMIIGVVLTVDASIMGRRRNPFAVLATWLGGAMSVLAQVESARERGLVAMIIASVFSITLIISVEAIAFGRKARAVTIEAREHPVAQVLAAPLPAPVSPAPAGLSQTRRAAAVRKPRRVGRSVSLPAPPTNGEMGRVPISPLTGRPLTPA